MDPRLGFVSVSKQVHTSQRGDELWVLMSFLYHPEPDAIESIGGARGIIV
jgi:hypothetical protein